jgi:hypothetical protein
MAIDDFGKTLLVFGVLLAVLGGLMLLVGQVPWLGRLPGDISIQRGNVRLYAPIATCLLLSLVLTVVLNLLSRR